MGTPIIRLRDVVDGDLPVFFEHQRDPEAIAMGQFPSRDHGAFMEHRALAHDSARQPELEDEGDRRRRGRRRTRGELGSGQRARRRVMAQDALALALALALGLASCTTLTAAGAKVRVVGGDSGGDAGSVSGCRYIGPIEARATSTRPGSPLTGNFAVARSNARNDARNKAAKAGADTLVDLKTEDDMFGVTATGDAYDCSAGNTSDDVARSLVTGADGGP